MAMPREREREREEPTYNTETKSAKLERLRSARLILHNLKATNSRHAKAISKIMD
jgi:glyceraldehyde-3-phosphate dehydrogenase/erythrose-4-phosphate dehydrogenase